MREAAKLACQKGKEAACRFFGASGGLWRKVEKRRKERILAQVEKRRKELKVGAKRMEKGSKMQAKWPQNGARMESEDSLEASLAKA